MRPVCVKCGKEMSCEKNGVVVWHPYEKPEAGPVVEDIGGVRVINVDRMIDPMHYVDRDRVDFMVNGDMYKCPICEYEIVTGFGKSLVDYEWSQEILKKQVKCAEENGRAIRITRR